MEEEKEKGLQRWSLGLAEFSSNSEFHFETAYTPFNAMKENL